MEITGMNLQEMELRKLIESMREGSSPEERMALIAELGRRGDPRAVEPLLERLREQDSSIRRTVIEALYRLPSTRSVPALVERLKDKTEDWISRTYAADALGRIGSAAAIRALKERALDNSEDPSTRIYVMDLLCRQRRSEAIEVLMKCLRDGDPRIRKMAAKMMGRM